MARNSNEWASSWRTLGLGFTLLAMLVVGPLVGYVIGDWLDRKLGTSWLTWVFLVLGFAAAGRQVYVLARRMQREADQPPDQR